MWKAWQIARVRPPGNMRIWLPRNNVFFVWKRWIGEKCETKVKYLLWSDVNNRYCLLYTRPCCLIWTNFSLFLIMFNRMSNQLREYIVGTERECCDLSIDNVENSRRVDLSTSGKSVFLTSFSCWEQTLLTLRYRFTNTTSPSTCSAGSSWSAPLPGTWRINV